MLSFLTILLTTEAADSVLQQSLPEALNAKVVRMMPSETVGASRGSWRAMQYVVSNDGSIIWREYASMLQRYDLALDRNPVIEFSYLAAKGKGGVRARLPIIEFAQFEQLRYDKQFNELRDSSTSGKASIRTILDSRSPLHVTLHYWCRTGAKTSVSGISFVDLRIDGWKRAKALVELAQGAQIESAARDRSSEKIAYLVSRSKIAGGKKRWSFQLRFVGGQKEIKLTNWGRPDMLYDSTSDLIVMSGDPGWLTVCHPKSKKLDQVRLPNAGATKMEITSLAWERAGTVLVGISKTEKWNNGKLDYSIPKLYRFDPLSSRWTYLGCYCLLGSSLRGDWLLIGDGPRLEKVWLMKATLQ